MPDDGKQAIIDELDRRGEFKDEGKRQIIEELARRGEIRLPKSIVASSAASAVTSGLTAGSKVSQGRSSVAAPLSARRPVSASPAPGSTPSPNKDASTRKKVASISDQAKEIIEGNVTANIEQEREHQRSLLAPYHAVADPLSQLLSMGVRGATEAVGKLHIPGVTKPLSDRGTSRISPLQEEINRQLAHAPLSRRMAAEDPRGFGHAVNPDTTRSVEALPNTGLSGAGKGVANTLMGFATVDNAVIGAAMGAPGLTKGAGEILGKAAAGYFGLEAAKQAHAKIGEWDRSGRKDTAALTEGILSAAIAATAGHHAAGSPLTKRVIPALARKATEHIERGRALQSKAQEAYQAAEEHLTKQAQEIVSAAGTEGAKAEPAKAELQPVGDRPVRPTKDQQAEIDRRAAARRPVQQSPAKPEPVKATESTPKAPERPAGETKAKEPVKSLPASKKAAAKPVEHPKTEGETSDNKTKAAEPTAVPETGAPERAKTTAAAKPEAETVTPDKFHEWVKARPQGKIRTTAADLYKAWKADHPATTEAQFGQMIHDLPRDQWEILTSPSGRTKFTATDSTGTPRQITGVRAKSNTGTVAEKAQSPPVNTSRKTPEWQSTDTKTTSTDAITRHLDAVEAEGASLHPAEARRIAYKLAENTDYFRSLSESSKGTGEGATYARMAQRSIEAFDRVAIPALDKEIDKIRPIAPKSPPAALSPRAPVMLSQAEANTLGMHFDKGHALGDYLTAAEKPFRVDAGQANYLRKLAEDKGLDKAKLPALFPDAPRKGRPIKEAAPDTKNIESVTPRSAPDKVPFQANRLRRSFAVGKKAILSRLQMETKRGLSNEAAEVAQGWIKALDPRYLDKLGSSYFKEETVSGSPGTYIGFTPRTLRSGGMRERAYNSLFEIGKALTNEHIEPGRVIPHEVAHHIETQVDPAHLRALETEYLRQQKQFGKAVQEARGTLQKIETAGAEALNPDGSPQRLNRKQAQFLSDSYRYKDFSEFFAESLADRAIEAHFKENAPAPARNIFSRMMDAARDFIKQTYDHLLGMPDKRPSQRIYDALMRGDYLRDSNTSALRQPRRFVLTEKDALVAKKEPQELHAGIPLDKALGAVVGKERAEAWTESVNKLGVSLRGLVNTTGFGNGSEVESRAGRDYFGQEARIADQREQAFKPLRATFDRLPAGRGVKFMFDIERDNVHADPKSQQVGDLLRDALDRKRDQINAQTGKLDAYFEHYFPHEWKSPSKATQFFGEGRRPLEGSKGFLKKRTIPTNEEGMFPKGVPAGLESMNEAQIREEITKQGGLQPLTLNPVELAQLKLQSMDRYLFAQKWFAEQKKMKRAVFLPALKSMPDGWAKVNDAIANVREFRQTTKADGSPGAPEIIERGSWIVPEGAARIINNHLSPGFSGHETFGSVYRVMAATNNAMNMAQLGLSGFHATTMAMESLVSENARALSKATQGKLVEAGQAALWSHTGAAPFRDFYRGSKILQEYRVPGSVGGNVPKIVESLVKGGGRVTLAKEFRLDAMESFGKALRKRDVPGMALSALPATLEGSMAWLMRDTVPKMKLGAFAELLEDEMGKATKGGKTLTEDQHRELASRVWDNIENRFGQLNYDNLFWDKAFKEAGHLAVRSLGWNLGTVREIGGAAVDVGRTRSRLAKGEGVLTPRMTYVVSLAYTTALAGAVYSYLHGHRPETPEDYFHPKNSRGERIMLPGYGKDIQKYHDDALDTLYGKISPLADAAIKTFQNKDFFGKPVRGVPGQPIEKRTLDYFRYLAKQVIPFSVRPKKDDSVSETIKKVFTTEEGREQAAGITPYHPNTGQTGKKAGGMSILPRVSTPRLPRVLTR